MAIAAIDEARRVKMEYVGACLTSKEGKVTVSETSSGHLYCVLDRTVWCEHISRVVTESRDAGPLYRHLRKTKPPMYRVVTPMLPTESLFADIQLVVWSGGEEIYKVMMEEPEGSPGRRAVADGDGIFLGFFNPGEGRMHLRQMILGWMEPELYDPPMTMCASMRHDWKRKAKIATECRVAPENATFKQRILFHKWCLKWWRKCGYCYQEEGPGSNKFDPDLIPGA